MAHKEKLKYNSPKVMKIIKKNIRYFFIFVILSLTTLLYLSLVNIKNRDVKVLVEQKLKNKITYVRQFSDSHITENAKSTDERFRKITFNNNSSLLGNIISSIKNSGPDDSNIPENGSWLWTPVLQISPSYRDRIIAESKKNGIKNLYLSIDSYLDIYILPEGEEKVRKEKEFDTILADFISKAKENDITIDAEAGWRNWAELGNSYKAFITLNYAIDFNKRHSAKFRGFQYDVEPYLLDYYNENTQEVLGNFINLIDESVAKLDGSDLRLFVVVPEFYDQNYVETPKIFYAGETLYPFEQLLRVLDKRDGSKVIVMAYRNYSNGKNGSIEVARDEIYMANKYKTKVILALETGEVEPTFVTFFNLKKSYFTKEKDDLKRAFENNKSYDGIAVHYINSYTQLR